MFALRLVAILAMMLWVGGLIALGAVSAPTLFAVLEARDPSTGRDLAGVLFGAMFTRFQYIAWICGVAVLLSLGARAALGPRPRRFGVRAWVAAAMLAASVGTVYLITPRIDTLRQAAPESVATLAPEDPRRVAFGRWHGASNVIMLLTVLGGIGLIYAEARDRH